MLYVNIEGNIIHHKILKKILANKQNAPAVFAQNVCKSTLLTLTNNVCSDNYTSTVVRLKLNFDLAHL